MSDHEMTESEINEQIDSFVEALGFDDDGYAVLFNEDTEEYEYIEDEDTLELVESLIEVGVIAAPEEQDDFELALQEAYEAGLAEGAAAGAVKDGVEQVAKEGGEGIRQWAKKKVQAAGKYAVDKPLNTAYVAGGLGTAGAATTYGAYRHGRSKGRQGY